jgi:hypothetical protein
MTCCLSNVKHLSHESSSRIRLGMVKAYGAFAARALEKGHQVTVWNRQRNMSLRWIVVTRWPRSPESAAPEDTVGR